MRFQPARLLVDLAEGLRISLRALRANKLRALLTTLGIVIGVTTVVMMITIVLGLNKSVEGQFSFLGSNTLYVSRWNWTFDDNGDWREMMKRRDMKREYVDRIREESRLAVAATPWAATNRTVSFNGGHLTRVDVFGVNQDYFVTNAVKLETGRFLSEDDVQRNRQVVVIGKGIATQLFEKVDPIGKRLDIGGYKFTVIGVNEKMGKFFGQNMDNFVVLPIGAHLKRFGDFRDMDIVVKAGSQGDVKDLEWELRGIMRRARHLGPLDPDDFGINSQSLIMDAYRQVTSGVYLGGILIAAISLLVGGVGIMNIMLVSVTERTSEVGLRKALGARRWNIAWQFLLESAAICSLGGVAGAGLAFAGGKALNNFLPTSMPAWVVGFSILFSALVGVFFGLYPSMKAARLSPIEALRQE